MALLLISVAVLVLLALNVIAVGLVLYMLREFRDGARAALQNLQVQLAFIAGRIGLDKRDLDRAVAQETEPDLPTEVLGATDWDEWGEEPIDVPGEGSQARAE